MVHHAKSRKKMRIAFVSYELPPSVAIGGIGTYAYDAVKMLAEHGNEVEVFCAGRHNCAEVLVHPNVTIHRFDVTDRKSFREMIVGKFGERHLYKNFDVLESPEFGCEGAIVASKYPLIARVVKLHTPRYLVERNSWESPSGFRRLRFTLGGLIRGRWNVLPTQYLYDPTFDLEKEWCLSADEIAAPSQAIANELCLDWSIPKEKVSNYPYPFSPSENLLMLPTIKTVASIGFLGRLEPRKGIVELCEAMPQILEQFPKITVRFIGPSWPYAGTDMQTWISRKLRKYTKQLTFIGAIGRDQLHHELGACDIVCLPSRWESFGLACAEAMASGRAVIGSSAGGMADMIEHGRTGLLVSPRNPKAIADAISQLVREPDKAQEMAFAGRASIQEQLSATRIYPLQMASYHRAIEQASIRNIKFL